MLYGGATLQPLEGAQGSLSSTTSIGGLRMGQVKIILLDLGLREWLFSLDPLVLSNPHALQLGSCIFLFRPREDDLSEPWKEIIFLFFLTLQFPREESSKLQWVMN